MTGKVTRHAAVHACCVVAVAALQVTPSVASPPCYSQAEARKQFPGQMLHWSGPKHCWSGLKLTIKAAPKMVMPTPTPTPTVTTVSAEPEPQVTIPPPAVTIVPSPVETPKASTAAIRSALQYMQSPPTPPAAGLHPLLKYWLLLLALGSLCLLGLAVWLHLTAVYYDPRELYRGFMDYVKGHRQHEG